MYRSRERSGGVEEDRLVDVERGQRVDVGRERCGGVERNRCLDVERERCVDVGRERRAGTEKEGVPASSTSRASMRGRQSGPMIRHRAFVLQNGRSEETSYAEWTIRPP